MRSTMRLPENRIVSLSFCIIEKHEDEDQTEEPSSKFLQYYALLFSNRASGHCRKIKNQETKKKVKIARSVSAPKHVQNSN